LYPACLFFQYEHILLFLCGFAYVWLLFKPLAAVIISVSIWGKFSVVSDVAQPPEMHRRRKPTV